MKKTRTSQHSRPRSKPHLISILLALAIGLSSVSCTTVPVQGVQSDANGWDTSLQEQTSTPATTPNLSSTVRTGNDAESFAACPEFFVNGKPPVVAPRPTDRALCYDAFAILHSGESKTAVFVAQKLNRTSIADANKMRTNWFFPEARLRSAERATLEDYQRSGFDRGHLAPAADMPTAQAMAQSFSLANVVPQAPEHNRGAWAKSVEAATRKYAARATGDVYVITGPVFEPSIAESQSIGTGQVRVPKYLFKLVYDPEKNRAWAHWHLNDDATRGSSPISYPELVNRTGVNFLPGVNPSD